MCGFSGIFSFIKNINQSQISAVKKMTDSIAHRGPDDSKFYDDENLCLGLRRQNLKIPNQKPSKKYNREGSNDHEYNRGSSLVRIGLTSPPSSVTYSLYCNAVIGYPSILNLYVPHNPEFCYENAL